MVAVGCGFGGDGGDGVAKVGFGSGWVGNWRKNWAAPGSKSVGSWCVDNAVPQINPS